MDQDSVDVDIVGQFVLSTLSNLVLNAEKLISMLLNTGIATVRIRNESPEYVTTVSLTLSIEKIGGDAKEA